MSLSDHEREALRRAKRLLEHPGLVARIAELVGTPIDRGLQRLPVRWQRSIQSAANKALQVALSGALASMDKASASQASARLHKLLGAAAGAAGGFFGPAALALELPISTMLMLRSIADIARAHGEDLREIEPRLACLQVFALGDAAGAGATTDTGYFAVRASLARAVAEAAEYIAERGIAEEGAPAIVQLVSRLATRFAVPVSEKALAQAVPVIGALGGAALNTLFMAHFQAISEGHFSVRELERKHGTALVQREYAALST
jgi:hypothetical protein